MTTMPLARIHGPHDIKLDAVDRPVAGVDDVLIQVEICGICGSDVSYSKIGGIPGAAKPFAIGHEFSGVVVEAGANVSHVQPGDRVIANPEVAGNGIGSAGLKGAFAPYILFNNAAEHPYGVIKLPKELDFEFGALVEPLSVAMHGINQGQITAQDKILIFGAGPIGLSAGIVARYYGVENVVVADLSAKRLAIAEQMGLIPFKADEGDIESFLKEVHGTVVNDPLLGEQPATDVFLEMTGVGSVFQQIVGMARKGARVVVTGVHFAPVELNMINLLMRELVITAATGYPTEFPDVVKMVASGKVDISPLVTHRFALSQFDEAFAVAKDAEESVKVMISCQQ